MSGIEFDWGIKPLVDDFARDVDYAVRRMMVDLQPDEGEKLLRLRDQLLRLYSLNMVKINHSIMELVCAKHLIQRGFDVEIEHPLNGVSCDIYAAKGYGTHIVEVETGFVPPENALDPITYLRARIASKITRYSRYSDKFSLGAPPYYVMQIPHIFFRPPRMRGEQEIAEVKRLCDLYYRNPPVTLEEVRNARIHSLYIINVDSLTVSERGLEDYLERAALWSM